MSVRISLTLEVSEMFFFLHTFIIFSLKRAAAVVWAVLEKISGFDPSLEMTGPRYLKFSTVSTVMILSIRTDTPGQTVQTQIRLLRSLIRVYTICHSVCIVWTHYSVVEPHSSNFRVIKTNVLGVRIFRKFTVVSDLLS